MTTYHATIEERGNGLAGAGEYVSADGNVYRVVRTDGPIHTGAPGQANYVHAIVEDADWSDVTDDDEPYCTAVIGDARHYTYTIYDANPQASIGTAWPSHDEIEIAADSDEEAVEDVERIMRVEAAGLSPAQEYQVGDTLYAIVTDEDGVQVGPMLTYDLTSDDLGLEREIGDDSRQENDQ